VNPLPTEAELLGWFETLSNWGRWGADDQLGTLNLITREHRRKAAALVVEGINVSCAWNISTMPQVGDHFGPAQRHMLMTGEGLADPHRVVPPHPVPGIDMSRSAGAVEYFGCVFHGINITHMQTYSRPEPGSGAAIYTMRIHMDVPTQVGIPALRERLERIADELHIHIDLVPGQGNG